MTNTKTISIGTTYATQEYHWERDEQQCVKQAPKNLQIAESAIGDKYKNMSTHQHEKWRARVKTFNFSSNKKRLMKSAIRYTPI